MDKLVSCVLTEGEHSKGLLIGDHSRRVAVLRNLFAHNTDRNPVFKGDTSALIANNVVYDPGELGIVHYGDTGCCPSVATVVGNQILEGPSTGHQRLQRGPVEALHVGAER